MSTPLLLRTFHHPLLRKFLCTFLCNFLCISLILYGSCCWTLTPSPNLIPLSPFLSLIALYAHTLFPLATFANCSTCFCIALKSDLQPYTLCFCSHEMNLIVGLSPCFDFDIILIAHWFLQQTVNGRKLNWYLCHLRILRKDWDG